MFLSIGMSLLPAFLGFSLMLWLVHYPYILIQVMLINLYLLFSGLHVGLYMCVYETCNVRSCYHVSLFYVSSIIQPGLGF